jgi:hypothetical protein
MSIKQSYEFMKIGHCTVANENLNVQLLEIIWKEGSPEKAVDAIKQRACLSSHHCLCKGLRHAGTPAYCVGPFLSALVSTSAAELRVAVEA